MLFNSISFAIFLPIVFIFYWFVAGKSLKFQNFLLLVASYFFYSCWDWRFLFLLIFSTSLDYYTGLKIAQSSEKSSRMIWLWISILVNLGFLGVFKYYNFFVDSFAEALAHLGLHVEPWTLNVILPVGISFYTFHGLSYVIDIYNNKIPPEKNFTDYAVFVSFFPLLVAGPIERATHLLPQVKVKRVFDYRKAVGGVWQILWGLLKKVVIADNCATAVNVIFDNYESQSAAHLVLGAILFAFQIYSDFSGYSDIAIGTAKLFGFDLLINFRLPYFSRDIAEFWRRWHISLSTWFRDYLYIPLGGSKNGKLNAVRNTFITFIVSGFWHGANWTFIIWGALNALYFLPLLLLNKNRINTDTVAQEHAVPTFRELFQMLFTFLLTCIAWVFFRSESVTASVDYLKRLITIQQGEFNLNAFIIYSVLLTLFTIAEWVTRRYNSFSDYLMTRTVLVQRIVVGLIVVIIILLGNFGENEFIYFQF